MSHVRAPASVRREGETREPRVGPVEAAPVDVGGWCRLASLSREYIWEWGYVIVLRGSSSSGSFPPSRLPPTEARLPRDPCTAVGTVGPINVDVVVVGGTLSGTPPVCIELLLTTVTSGRTGLTYAV